uniref:Transposase n=1 Tax=Mesocestoides corti TaxID=53468 RepID=A0A5K3G2D2_MESCO
MWIQNVQHNHGLANIKQECCLMDSYSALGLEMWRRIGWQTYLTTLVSANPLSLCVPMACEQDRHAA